MADEYGLDIGDTVTLSKENKADYLITGLYQSTNDLGMCIAMSYDAYKRIGNRIPDILYIKLADSSLAKEVTDFLNETYPGKVEAVLSDPDNTQMKLIETILIGISALIYIISIVFALITVSIVCTRSFLRERIDIGIYKALGFTVRQLRLQFSFRFLTVSAIGSILGVIFCILLCPSMMKLLLRGLGITNFTTDYTLGIIILPVCMICFCFFLFAYLVSGRIKKVEVKELISE
ncbi:MAG: ABC transporter permease [Lachnospiraceae bacterium]|nr:ABC transporter permease [Lachnospiraceae bacterium]